jgi:hypothetical protein
VHRYLSVAAPPGLVSGRLANKYLHVIFSCSGYECWVTDCENKVERERVGASVSEQTQLRTKQPSDKHTIP